jgi:glycosyltransferase involved in cell wall biosynthesis
MLGNNPSVKGGITSVMSQLLQYNWDKDHIKMKFVATYVEGSKVRKTLYFSLAYLRILFVILTYHPNVVHIHMSYKGSFTRKAAIQWLCKKFGIRDIIHLHGSEFETWYHNSNAKLQRKIRHVLRECDYFIVLGMNWRKIIRDIEPSTNIVVVSNTVPIPSEVAIWNHHKFQVLFLGVLIERKGVADLLHAIHVLEKNNEMEQVEFVIAGTGKEEENLKSLCKRLSIEHCVTFTGWTCGDQKKKLLQESQLLVLPSYHEGLPIAILEALSYGLPVISTDVGSINEAVKDGINGYLITPGDINKLAQSIRKISSNQQRWLDFSHKAREIATSRFSEEEYFRNIGKIYHESSKG